jgi:hypothetical protein
MTEWVTAGIEAVRALDPVLAVFSMFGMVAASTVSVRLGSVVICNLYSVVTVTFLYDDFIW